MLLENRDLTADIFQSSYLNSKITLAIKSVNSDSDLSIGTSKEILESVCKSILESKRINIERDWSFQELIKNTQKSINFLPKGVSNPEKGAKSIFKIKNGINSIIQGIGEIRNEYGSGHGKNLDFKSLDYIYSRFILGISLDLATFLSAFYDKKKKDEVDGEDLPF